MHPNYILAQKLIQKANQAGYNRLDDPMACEYWWATKQYLEHEFARIMWGDGYRLQLAQLVQLDEQGEQQKYLASFL